MPISITSAPRSGSTSWSCGPSSRAPCSSRSPAPRSAVALARQYDPHRGDDDDDDANPYELIRDFMGRVVGVSDHGREEYGGMMDRARYRAGFPGRMQRWCTRELKIEPLRAYHDHVAELEGIETISVLGLRGDESPSRDAMEEWTDEPEGRRSWGGYIWRPILRWTVRDVLEIHNRNGIKVNPLYRKGHNRVGCWPCIYATKEEISLLPTARIAELRDDEAEVTEIRRGRNVARPGRYAHELASFFQTKRKGFEGIDAVVRWSHTDRGGRQIPIFDQPPRGGCMKWGLCDMPSAAAPPSAAEVSDAEAEAEAYGSPDLGDLADALERRTRK
jgi:3'-phosphoadenosine 5'-phosphosulfate sulfotransferase (PAPS reductase)/FAD synthetase